MKLLIKERAFTTGMIILAVVVVIVLGLLQYRWTQPSQRGHEHPARR